MDDSGVLWWEQIWREGLRVGFIYIGRICRICMEVWRVRKGWKVPWGLEEMLEGRWRYFLSFLHLISIISHHFAIYHNNSHHITSLNPNSNFNFQTSSSSSSSPLPPPKNLKIQISSSNLKPHSSNLTTNLSKPPIHKTTFVEKMTREHLSNRSFWYSATVQEEKRTYQNSQSTHIQSSPLLPFSSPLPPKATNQQATTPRYPIYLPIYRTHLISSHPIFIEFLFLLLYMEFDDLYCTEIRKN